MSVKDIAKTILNTEVELDAVLLDQLSGKKMLIKDILKEHFPKYLQQQLANCIDGLESAVPRKEYEKIDDEYEKMATPIKEDLEGRRKNIQDLLDVLPSLNEILAKAELDRPIDEESIRKSAAAIGFMIRDTKRQNTQLTSESPAQIATAFEAPKEGSNDIPIETTLEHFDMANRLIDTVRDQAELRVNFWTKLQGDLIDLANEAHKERQKS